MPSESGRRWYPAVVVGLFAVGLAAISLIGGPGATDVNDASAAQDRYASTPFEGKAAFADLRKICEIGPRPSGSPGMQQQQQLLTEHFMALGAKVSKQTFRVRHPVDGTPVEMSNLVVEWHPESNERFLLCAHYDTRPFPDRDAANPKGRFIGANDGGSGVAVLMELGRHMATLPTKRGVDFVFFDGEELVYEERHEYFHGSKHFAQTYRTTPPPYRYRAGVLLDMVADAQLFIRKEPNSLRYARFVVDDVWNAAYRLGVREFSTQVGQEIRDDHLPLNEIARIPTIDVIDFDYPYWHTEADVPEYCSVSSLDKVGKVIYEWLRIAITR